MASSVCPLCLSEIGKATSFKCPGCGSKYHKDCAADSGECIVVGCSAAAAGKKRSAAVSNKAISASASTRTKPPGKTVNRSALVIAVIVSLLIGAGAGYSAGDSAGYERGYANGESDGYADGYTKGKTDGDAAGYSRGYDEGNVYGCQRVFRAAGNYSYLTAYDPYSFGIYSRYPGTYYVSRSDC